MKKDIAHFDRVKNQNMKCVSSCLRAEESMSISQIAKATGLTYPTVSSLLKELEQQGEVLLCNETESCGGRPGVRYSINPAYHYALIAVLFAEILIIRIYDYLGKQVYEQAVVVDKTLTPEQLTEHIRQVADRYEGISVVSLGIPGVVYNNSIEYLPVYPKLQGKKVMELLEENICKSIYIENDMNAIVYYESEFKNEFCHVTYIDECVGVGIVHNGEVIRGSRGFAGEFEFLCDDISNKLQTIIRYCVVLISVLNPAEIILTGQGIEKILEQVKIELEKEVPKDRIPEISFIDNVDHYYYLGLLKHALTEWYE